MDELPEKPTAVVLGAALLLAGALALVLMWATGVDAVESNGARVFFVVLWTFLAWSAYTGGGWVRTAILAMSAVSAWGWLNAPSVADAVVAMSAGDQVAKSLALVALALLLSPPARRFFAAAREVQSRTVAVDH